MFVMDGLFHKTLIWVLMVAPDHDHMKRKTTWGHAVAKTTMK
jgi:hypothetical protein